MKIKEEAGEVLTPAPLPVPGHSAVVGAAAANHGLAAKFIRLIQDHDHALPFEAFGRDGIEDVPQMESALPSVRREYVTTPKTQTLFVNCQWTFDKLGKRYPR